MIKMFLSLVIIAMIIFFASEAIKTLSNKERWSLTKRIGYVILCFAIATVLLTSIVILF